jgi:hypothetical protein
MNKKEKMSQKNRTNPDNLDRPALQTPLCQVTRDGGWG